MTTKVEAGSRAWNVYTDERDAIKIGDVWVGIKDRMGDTTCPGVEFTFAVEDWRGMKKVSQGFLEGPGRVENPFIGVDIDSVEITR